MSLDSQLQQLLMAARQYPTGSFERQHTLNRLISLMQKSGRIWRGGGLLESDRYEEALQKTWLYFCRNLDRYDPSRAGVITWFNDYLRYRIHDSLTEQRTQGQRTIQPIAVAGENIADFWESLPAPEDIPPILDEVYAWLDTEVDRLQTIHLRNRPEINCWLLLQRRLPPEMPWKALSQEWGVPIPTLSNFYQHKCLPELIKLGQDLGYLDSAKSPVSSKVKEGV